ncbi:hypothetical protein BSK43_012470 [Rhizobium sp. P44RR-XXIV]|nr:hypothetical protein BSK43_012470 [Rhizobium sp. P44RR-XXIV]
MIFLGTVHRLFLLVAMLAVVVGPMSIGSAGSAMASSDIATMAGMASVMPGMQMTDNMPCCPERSPAKPDCAKGCPLALVCTTSMSAQVPDANGLSFAISWASHQYDLLPASQLTSALIEPPARPPRA